MEEIKEGEIVYATLSVKDEKEKIHELRKVVFSRNWKCNYPLLDQELYTRFLKQNNIKTSAEVISVDISWSAVMRARWSCRKFKNVKMVQTDALAFLEHYNDSIDLLFLDAWDVKPGSNYAENHVLAYQKAKAKLSKENIVSIDDTDSAGVGKARLLIPLLEQDNYEILVQGRQTIAVTRA